MFPVFEYRHDQGCSVTGGYVYRGAGAAERARPLRPRRLLRGTVWTLRVSSGEARDVRVEPFEIESLTSFGEDAAGELYAISQRRHDLPA